MIGDEPDADAAGVAYGEPIEAEAASWAPAAGGSTASLRGVPTLLGEMPAGAEVGTLIHRVLQDSDFAAGDLEAELGERVRAARAWRSTDVGDSRQLVAGLAAAIRTPLGALLGGARLRDVARQDRLDELRFELPLAGGDEPRGELRVAALAGVLREHLPAGDPMAGYAQRLEDPSLRAAARGYLTGSLDLVVRVRRGGGEDGGDGHGADRGTQRFAVIDYKTNRLAPLGEPLTAWHHRPAALAAEMAHRHYGLQALLYTVALHRYLRWRVGGYDPDVHLAGVLYLFLRGMTGPDTPLVDGTACGVFAWRPPGPLVTAPSDVLDRGSAA